MNKPYIIAINAVSGGGKTTMENADFVIDGSKIQNEIIDAIMSVIERRIYEYCK